jgi:transaldolase
MQTTKPNTKILVFGGNPKETQRLKSPMGFVDGQTSNPSLISKNPATQVERLGDSFNLSHELTRSGIEKFVADFEGTVG